MMTITKWSLTVVMVTSMIVTKHDVVWQEGSIGKGMPAPMLLRRFHSFWVAIPPSSLPIPPSPPFATHRQ